MKKSFIKTAFLALSGLSLIFISGCATARSVNVQHGKGGVVAINPPHSADARAKAEEIMATTCGNKKYEVTEEGEAVIGETTSSNYRGVGGGSSLFGAGVSGNTESTQKTEWRLTYKCI